MKGRVLLWALLMGGSAQLSAQVDRASLVGTVTDSSGAVIPAARVEVLSQETGLRREAETGPNGVYTVSQLPIGVFDINISRPGFRTVTVKELRLGVGDNRTLNVTMEPSTVDTQITIQSEIVPIETTSPVIGTVIGSQQMREIPLNGRHWASLMALAPGAINTGDGSQQSIRFVGRARDDNNWTFDGLDATGVKDPRQEAALRLVISTDTIAEFRVNSTLYSADQGGGAGGQVNLVSKSGSNQFHGSLFEFFRNDKMDARNPFDTSKQPFRLNQFGGNIGGPIIRNRTFFFANYEGLRQRVTQTITNDVPSAAFRARATDPAIRQLVGVYPAGTISTSNADIDRVQANRSQAWEENAGTIRIDHRFNDNNTIFGRYNVDNGVINRAAQRSSMATRQNDNFRPSNFVLQYQRIFSPTVINEVKAGFNRSTLRRVHVRTCCHDSIAVAGFQTLNQSNLLDRGRHVLLDQRQPGDHPGDAHDQDRRRDPARSRERCRSVVRFRHRHVCGSATISRQPGGIGGDHRRRSRARHPQVVLLRLRAGRLESAAESDTESRPAV